MQVEGPAGPIWVVALHINWPWPFHNPGQVDDMAEAMSSLEGDMLVAGDFNMVAGTDRVRRLNRAVRSDRLGLWVPTFSLPLGYRLQIDHVLSTRAGQVFAAPGVGSDHLPLVADIW